MIRDSREKEVQIKQEEGTIDYTMHQTSKRLCSSIQNQRIMRVSQADHFGGKDRHSKISTIKGLRDRRVRLSIPTAIQVYDLQDKLGLNQPSKVVDWLISAAQNEIDKLPPPPLSPHGSSFIQFPPSAVRNIDEQNLNSNSISSQAFSVNTDPLMIISNNYVDDIASFPKSTLNSFNSYHQMEPYNVSHVGNNYSQVAFQHDFHLDTAPSSLPSSSSSPLALMQTETQLMMPSLFSSYLTSTNNFQTPSTFAQLLPWNSSSINFKQYIHHDEAAQQQENMRGTSTTVYKDSGAGYNGYNAGDFF
ncbi:hypothetical protein IEQ34_004631 [Dendrobium chrysotoxum]|uniref:TCP domain-containing protein n=1 Tax=Dendrobium chrysotoxum TaxID=161865 RepID=A0AAV7HIQ2_DENCH|nr:hypothetical protein IEQ34_004631 [Dendrobium chrysotoxum]